MAELILYGVFGKFTLQYNLNRMKNLFAALIIIIPLSVNSQDIRSFYWGDSMERIKEIEGKQEWTHPESKDGIQEMIYFSSTISELETYVCLFFIDNRLTRSKYVFLEEHSNENLYLSDFKSIDEILQEKYGKEETRYKWRRDLYKDDSDRWGFAVSIGDLFVATNWDTEKTFITHALYGDNYEITHAIEYVSLELKNLYEEKKKEKQKSVF